MKFKKKILAMVLPAVIISISAMAAMVVVLNYGYMKNTAKQTAIYGASSCTEKIEEYFNEYWLPVIYIIDNYKNNNTIK